MNTLIKCDNLVNIEKKDDLYSYKPIQKKTIMNISNDDEDIYVKLYFVSPIKKIKIYNSEKKIKKVKNVTKEKIKIKKKEIVKILLYFENLENKFKVKLSSYTNHNYKIFCDKLNLFNLKNHNFSLSFDPIFYINYYEDAQLLDKHDALKHYNKKGNYERIPNLYVLCELNNIELIDIIKFNKLKNKNKSIYQLLKKKYNDFDYDFYLNIYKNDFIGLNLNSHEKALKHYYFTGRHHKKIYNKNQIKSNYETLFNLIENDLIEQKEMKTTNYNKFSILTRSNRRPTYFKRFYESLFKQVYDISLINLVVSCHNEVTKEYLSKYENIKIIDVIETTQKKDMNNPYPYNIYLNDLVNNAVENSWVIFIDDDDYFINEYSLQTINYEIENIKNGRSNNNFSLLWRVIRCDQLLGDVCFGKTNLNLQILPLCGFTIHSSKLDLFKFDTQKIANQTRKIQGKVDIYWTKYILTKIGQEEEIAGFGFAEI